MDNGWIKLHRKLLDNPLMNRPAYRSVWIEILLRATHDGVDVMFGGQRVRLEPGQFTTGTHAIAASTGVPRATVARILQTFKSEHQIEQRTDRQCSMITVLKWKEYQNDEQRNEQRVSNERATSEQRVSTKQECKNERMKEIPDSEAALIAPTPSQEAAMFFENSKSQEDCSVYMSSKGIDRVTSDREIAKFVRYWTEPTKNGKKQRWELQKTFEVKRRLVTWFGNLQKQGSFNSESKGITI